MKSSIERIRELASAEKKRRKVLQQFSPYKYVNTRKVYEYIANGHKAGGGPYMIGATDDELRWAFKDMNPNTVRWCRWILLRNGFIEGAGIRRSWLNGSEMPVWVITDKQPGYYGDPELLGKYRCNAVNLGALEEKEPLIIEEIEFLGKLLEEVSLGTQQKIIGRMKELERILSKIA